MTNQEQVEADLRKDTRPPSGRMTRAVRRLLQDMLDGERLLPNGREFVLSTSRRAVRCATVDEAMRLEYVARVLPPRAYVLMPRGVMALAREAK